MLSAPPLQLRNRLVALSELQSAVKLHEARTRSLSVQVEEAHAALSKERESNEAIRRQVCVRATCATNVVLHG